MVTGGGSVVSPGDVEVVAFVYHLYGVPVEVGEPRRSKLSGNVFELSATAREIDCASLEMEAARAATHSAVALRSAPSGGNT